MTKEKIFNAIQKIFRDVFDNNGLIITKGTNSDNIEDWDSLNHINIISAIEQEFGIKFALSELIALNNVGDMVDLAHIKVINTNF
jgi:acyl carrier protein